VEGGVVSEGELTPLNAPPIIIHESEGVVQENDVSPPVAIAPPFEPHELFVLIDVHKEVSVVLIRPSPTQILCIPRSFAPLINPVNDADVPVPELLNGVDAYGDVWSTLYAEIAPLVSLSMLPAEEEQVVAKLLLRVTTTLFDPVAG
jgi:hypothetical protein